MPAVSDHTGQLHDQPVFWRSAPANSVPTLFLHGVPTCSDDWLPFLELIGGVAPDLPGFGRSGKRGDGDYTMEGYDRFIEAFLDLAEIEGPVNLVVHDWGGVGLLWAQRFPERVHRLVIMNTVPLGQTYRWHWIARMWRRRIIGELFMGSTSRWALRKLLKPATTLPEGMPDHFLDSILDHLDQGTQRAILRLYRTSPSDKLLVAGTRLDEISAPALVVWGGHDPYIAAEHGRQYADMLPRATLRPVPQAGHWPWIDDPTLIEEVCAFLTDAPEAPPPS